MILAGFMASVTGQSNIWPENLSLPDTSQQKTSKKPLINFKNSLIVNDIVKSSNMLTVTKSDSISLLEQHLGYSITDFNNGVQSQSVDLSGSYLKNRIFGSSSALGIDWTPGLYYYKSKSSGILQVPIDLGPVSELSIYSIPVELRGGISAYGWNDEFNRTSGFLSRGNYHGDPGYYGGCNIGDSILRWFNLPIVANFGILGKSIGGTALVVMKSSLQTAWGSRSNDSIYFMAGDSVSNGKELYGAGSNSTLYSTTPWKVNHNFSLTGAIRGKERFFLRPAALYSYSLKNIKYPSQPDLLDDMRINKNNLTLQAATEGDRKITYSGGISFEWDNTDWIYNADARDISSDTTASGEKKRAVNLGDFDEFITKTDHDILLNLPYGFALNYQLHCAKNSKKYPYSYINGKHDTISNSNENDRVMIQNHGGILFTKDSVAALELYAEAIKNYQYYYRKERSGESMVSNETRIGCNAQFAFSKFAIDETFFAVSDKGDYKFKNVHKGVNFDPPPYSRKFSSLMIVKWFVSDRWTVTGKWNEVYFDYGKWYGKAYSDNTVTIDKNAYAIESKSTDYTLQLLAGYTGNKIEFDAGVLFRDNYLRVYDFTDSTYRTPENQSEDFLIEPSVRLAYIGKIGILEMNISRKFNTADPDIRYFSKKWILSLTTNLAF